MIKLCIFDLDGTLLYSVPDIAASINYALSQFGLPAMELSEVQNNIGNGLTGLLKNAVPADRFAELAEKLKTLYMQHHAAHCTDKSYVYAQIPETLAYLSEKGVKLAVNTNKPHVFLESIMDKYFPGTCFERVTGAGEYPNKPAPDAVLAIMEELAARPDECLYIGDSRVDIETAKNAGICGIGVAWGFRSVDELVSAGAAAVIHKPEELKHIIEKF